MDTIVIVVLEVFFQNPAEMRFAEDDDPIQTFPADTAVKSLGIWILPGAAISSQNFFDPHVFHSPSEPISIYRISISKQILWRCVPRKSLDYLLRCPIGSRMRRDIEMNDATSVYRENHQYIEHCESDRWSDNEVD